MGEKEKLERKERRKHPCPKCGSRLYPRHDEDVRIVEIRERHEGGDPRDEGNYGQVYHYYYYRLRFYRRFICHGKYGCGWKGRWKKVHDGTKEDAT